MGNLIFFGPPGCGKGTQAIMLVDKLGYKRISTGDLLRSIAKEDSALGREINTILSNGNLVNDDLVNKLIDDFYNKLELPYKAILDGYPRTIEQAKALDLILKKYNTEVNQVFHFNVVDDILVKRVTGRYTCDDCGAIYNSFFCATKSEYKCDKCGSSRLSKRSDDSEEVVINRLRVFRSATEPLLDYYNKKLISIDAEQSAEEVFEQIVTSVK